MAYTITASQSGATISASRLRPASAGVLAQKWVAQGRQDVRIECAGRTFDVAGFMAQFVLTGAGMKPRPLKSL